MGRMKDIPETAVIDDNDIAESEPQPVVNIGRQSQQNVTRPQKQHTIADLTDLELKAFAYDLICTMRETEEKLDAVNGEMRRRANS